MANLSTKYMGIELANPIVVGACSLSKRIDSIKQIEEVGAGALVIKSLFEEQVQLERAQFDEELASFESVYAEAMDIFPRVEHGGPKEHLFWVKEARKAVNIPIFASLNAVTDDVWVDWAKQLADTGVDGLELNFYSLPIDAQKNAADLEQQELAAFAKVREAVKIPISVKLHPYYTSLSNIVTEFDRLGADAVVLFNRLWQPDINIETEKETEQLILSLSGDAHLSLRWTALLYNRIKADIIGNSGIMTGQDAVKSILTGAAAVQVVSALYRNKIPYIETMLADMTTWMDAKGYETLDDFRGKLGRQNQTNPWSFERGQYIKALLGFD